MFGDAPPWTFTAPPQGATLTVTDVYLYGDVFEVFYFGVSLGTTSAPCSGAGCGYNPDVCVNDPLASHGVFQLRPGRTRLRSRQQPARLAQPRLTSAWTRVNSSLFT